VNIRQKILEIHTKDKPIGLDVDLRGIEEDRCGFSGAELLRGFHIWERKLQTGSWCGDTTQLASAYAFVSNTDVRNEDNEMSDSVIATLYQINYSLFYSRQN